MSNASDMIKVSGGEFFMQENSGITKTMVNDFYIAKTETTVSELSEALNWALSNGMISVDSNRVMMKSGQKKELVFLGTSLYGIRLPVIFDGAFFSAEQGKENYPVYHITWYGAALYCNWKSAMKELPLCYDIQTWDCDYGKAGYRLPRSAEWEYAMRSGGKPYLFSWGTNSPSDNIADESARRIFPEWICWDGYDDGFAMVSPVGNYQPNELGLYDMTGNVWEWCDWQVVNYSSISAYGYSTGLQGSPAVRGGSWISPPSELRLSYRTYRPSLRVFNIGFRVAKSAVK